MVFLTEEFSRMFPKFHRAIVIAQGIRITGTNPTIQSRLEAVQSEYADSHAAGEGAAYLAEKADTGHLVVWEDAYRAFQVNPRKFRPSICQLADRVRKKGKPLPFINEAVAAFNIISLDPRYRRPCGGDDLDQVVGNAVLGLAQGNETFEPLGQPEVVERPDVGEVIYYDDATSNVLCRRLSWRNGHRTRITESTRNALINVDGLFEPDRTREAAEELASMIRDSCGGIVSVGFLDVNQRRFDLRV
jgi:DNA/RNA-binding domain of Phe-tRNA-synthetase-like protein